MENPCFQGSNDRIPNWRLGELCIDRIFRRNYPTFRCTSRRDISSETVNRRQSYRFPDRPDRRAGQDPARLPCPLFPGNARVAGAALAQPGVAAIPPGPGNHTRSRADRGRMRDRAQCLSDPVRTGPAAPREAAFPGGPTVRKIAIRPMASEVTEAETIVAASTDELERVLTVLAQPKRPTAPLERLLELVDGFRYSTGDEPDPLSATARTPCWAINLAATARGDAFRLSETALPFPGLAQRRLFRADRGAQEGAPTRANICSRRCTPPPATSPGFRARRRSSRVNFRANGPTRGCTSPGCCYSASAG